MSKVSHATLNEAIDTMLNFALKEKKRKFVETVELQVNLKSYDVNKDKRFSGTHRLPHVSRPRFRVGIICDEAHQDKAKALGLLNLNMDDLKKLNKNKKLIKKLCHSYDAFLASDSVIKNIPKIVGPQLNRAGMFPTAVGENDDLKAKVEDVQATVKFQLKKVLCLGQAVGHVGMTKEQLSTNIHTAINFLVSLLKKRWQNVKTLYLKSTMGPSQRLY